MRTRLFVLFALFGRVVYSQDSTQVSSDTMPGHVFKLGEVVVTAERNKGLYSTISASQLQFFAKTDVSKALNLLPGITLSAVGPRNEAMIYLRGFDLRQVPLFIDGIPVYIPYDGYVDLARFTTFDLAEINVSKGYTSVLYGPNALGGAINLISRKPVKKLNSMVPPAGCPAGTEPISMSVATWVNFIYRLAPQNSAEIPFPCQRNLFLLKPKMAEAAITLIVWMKNIILKWPIRQGILNML